jgi:hypothetical protein
MHFYLGALSEIAAIPKIRKFELARRVGQRRVKDQTDGEEEIAFADAVLAQQHDIIGERDINSLKISKVQNAQPGQSHYNSLLKMPQFLASKLPCG